MAQPNVRTRTFDSSAPSLGPTAPTASDTIPACERPGRNRPAIRTPTEPGSSGPMDRSRRPVRGPSIEPEVEITVLFTPVLGPSITVRFPGSRPLPTKSVIEGRPAAATEPPVLGIPEPGYRSIR